jgi:hypothetical protein
MYPNLVMIRWLVIGIGDIASRHLIPDLSLHSLFFCTIKERHMRISPLLRGLPLLLALISPALLRCQFQQPTADELKMTADPKAPGAAAVYLYYEENANNAEHSNSFYVRIKVLTEKGKDLATVRIPYDPEAGKIVKIQGRTIHADGTVIPFIAKPDNLTDYQTSGFQENSAVFTLPSVEVGSILEYRYRFSGMIRPPTWWIQQMYFVHKAHYSFIHNNYGQLLYAAYLSSRAKVINKPNEFILDITDVPSQPDEEWMPPLNTTRWRVEFYYTRFNFAKSFWDYASMMWAMEVKQFTSTTSDLKNALAKIVAPGDTDQQKAAKIYAAVQKLNNTGFSRAKSDVERKREKLKDIHKAEDVWNQQGGSANQIALLYAALARAAGLKVWPMQVVNRNRALFDSSYLSAGQLDDFIVIVELGGNDVYLDPGQKMCPFGELHWKHSLASGFRLAAKDAVFAATPAVTYNSPVLQRIATLSIEENGNVKGSIRFVMGGQNALYWRQLALEYDVDEVKKQFNESVQNELPLGVQADFDHFLGLDEYNGNLTGSVLVSGNIGTVAGKHFLLPGLFFDSRAEHPFVAQSMRITPIDLHYATMEQDDVTYSLPPGFTVESAPQADLSWSGHASLKIESTVDNGSVRVVRAVSRNFAQLDSNAYNDLHDFYLKVAAADQQQIILTKSPAAPAPESPASK